MIGTKIAHYEITDKIGEGGMGVVYKALDTHLDRFVAIKVLPPEKVANLERKRRFVQEAKAASALNHANIITIYDIDQANGVDFIAMEYAAGKSLEELIPRKGMRLDGVLKLAVQIADALEAAHEAGIVHRDIKPGNIMVTEKGQVKVLDFGLAKLTDRGESSELDLTRTGIAGAGPNTEEGTILGSAAYMSPEQAEGRKVDARSDIFSFGVLLYEMVAGHRPFQGDSRMSTLAAIIRDEPKPLETEADDLPGELRRIINRCLRKDPSRRFLHIGDVKIALEDLKEESDSGRLPANAAGVSTTRSRRPMAVIVLAGIALAVAGWFWFYQPKARDQVAAPIAVPLTSDPGFERWPSFSPDGNQVAYSWNGEQQDNYDIYVKLIGTGGTARITTDPAVDSGPAWAPDGRFIAFVRTASDGKAAVYLVPAIGGRERKLAELPRQYYGTQFQGFVPRPAWLPDSKSLVIDDGSGLSLLSAETGAIRSLTTTAEGSYFQPAVSPDGSSVAFVHSRGWYATDLMLLALADDLTPSGEPKAIVSNAGQLVGPAWTSDGRDLVFSSAYGTQYAGLWRIAVSEDVESPRQLLPGASLITPAFSRDGRRLVYTQQAGDGNIWRLELSDPSTPASPPVKFIASTHSDGDPHYSPDGKRLAFVSSRSGNGEIWVCDADGANSVQLTSLGESSGTPRWSPDGKRIAFDSNLEGSWDIYVVNQEGGAPRRIASSPAEDSRASWSHDGEWVYFRSDRTGRWEVWKTRPDADGASDSAIQVTTGGGADPWESPDGKYLYYPKGSRPYSLWRVPIEGGEEAQVLEPVIFSEVNAILDQGVYFVGAPGAEGTYPIRFFDFSTGETATATTVAEIDSPSSFPKLAVSPDGRWLVYLQTDSSGADLVLVENFR